MENFDTYFYSKFYQCLLYDDEICYQALHGKYDFYLFNQTFIEVFIELTYQLINLKTIDETRIDALQYLISYIRHNAKFEDQETKKYFYDIFNDLIIKLNIGCFDNIDDFYSHEIAKRFNCAGKKINLREFENRKKFVKKSLGYDYLFLVIHLETSSEELFNSLLDDILNNEYYFASLNAILYEYPELLEIETFKRRVKKIVEINKKNLPSLLEKKLATKIYILKNNFKYSSLCI